MVDNGLTKTYALQLTFEGPCFTGSGAKISKKEYLYNTRKRIVSFYDSSKLMDCILEYGLINEYETYMLGSGRTLYDFFYANGGAEKFASALKYQVGSGDAIQGYGRQPVDILTHIRNALGDVYIPGSSVKGMLRTVITIGSVLKKIPKAQKPSVPEGSPENRFFKKSIVNDANACMRQLDEELFHTLGADPKKIRNAVNSIFRGVSIADSQPISDKDLVLCRKMDLYPNGNPGELNLVRECVRPGVEVKLPITFDPSLAKFVTPEFIKESIALFDDWFMKNVFSHYQGMPLPQLTNHLFLGGGSGYPTKTVTGPWLQDDALHYITLLLTVLFKKKNVSDENYYGVSPHMLKYTTVNGQKMPFGLCRVDIL